MKTIKELINMGHDFDEAERLVEEEKRLEKIINIIEPWRLETRFRNDDETGEYVKGYKDGYDKAIENVLKAVREEI